jgi:predicted Rossmann fold nucleotide-binding protein DprA/Smf involved in DNA uptake
MELGELVGMSAPDLEVRLRIAPEKAAQLAELLERHGQLAFELERLERLGMWYVTVEGDGYPQLLLERLGSGAPPILFGLGGRSLFGQPGLAVVGSRDASPAALEMAREAGAQAARQGWVLVSGAARGVDAESMRGAFEAGGQVIGAAPDGLERHLRDASLRSAFADGSAAYVSPYRPDARFTVGAAMGRNKLIYCLAQAAVVVHTAAGSGGTWSGAIEALKHHWVPVYVSAEGDPVKGNEELVQRGGTRLLRDDLNDLDALPTPDATDSQGTDEAPGHSQQTLFEQ